MKTARNHNRFIQRIIHSADFQNRTFFNPKISATRVSPFNIHNTTGKMYFG